MKKNLLTIGLSLISLLVVAQKNDTALISSKIQEFKNRLYLSTSKDPLALIKAKTIKMKELVANELVAKTSPTDRLKTGEVEGAYIDTTHSYPWNVEMQDWDTIPTTRIIKHFDDQHNLVQYLDFLWNAETESWMENVQFFYIYNEANQPIDVIQQAWQFDGYENYNWINIDHGVYGYNELGQQSSYTYQYVGYETNEWEDSWKQEFFYDEKGNNIELIESYWDGGMSEWTPGLSVSNEYDSNNNIIVNPIKYWDYNSNNWTNAYKNLFEYDSKGNNNLVIVQYWNTDIGDWENLTLQTLIYNETNSIESYDVKLWDSFLSDWFILQRATFQYDSNGNNICIIGEDYDSYSNTWTTSWTSYYEYNDKNKLISDATLYWDSGIGYWSFGSKTKDAKINLLALIEHKLQIIASLEVFPNPAVEWVNIQNSSVIDQIEVYDISGSKILNQDGLGLNKVRLDLANLRAGVYFLMIKDMSGNSTTKRLVKQ